VVIALWLVVPLLVARNTRVEETETTT